MEFLLQPEICKTSSGPTLMSLLEKIWIKDLKSKRLMGKGTFYILSGFSNFNGGVRFYNCIEKHIADGGRCEVILGGSTSQNMSSQQVVKKLLEIGCKVGVVNRKAIFHAKCYGYQTDGYKTLIVSSGNFTSCGLTQNIEASLLLENEDFNMDFDWNHVMNQIRKQKIDYYEASLNEQNLVWKLLYDEFRGKTIEDKQSLFQTLIMTLSHIDVARIQAEPKTNASKGTQYFWLSKDSFDFFPPLDLKNERGTKNAYQTLVSMKYVDLDVIDTVRVTFEADNNLDFRLGTSRLKNTRIADEGDMVAITRTGFDTYEMRIFKKDSYGYDRLISYATTYIGHKGKRYGYISNRKFFRLFIFK